MTSLTRIAVIALAVSVAAPGAAAFAQYASSPVQVGYAQEGGWDAPPSEMQEAARRGFHDGIEGARRDFGNHRRPNVNNRDEFRHPGVPREERRDYQEGFRRGYDVATSHLYQAHDHDRDHDRDHDDHH